MFGITRDRTAVNTSYYPSTHQSIAYTGTAGTISNAVGAATTQVRVYCTTDAYIKIGSSPTATTSDIPVSAMGYEYFSIRPGEKVSAIRVSASGTLHVTEMVQ